MSTENSREKLLPQKHSVYFLIYQDNKFLLEKRIKEGSRFYGYTIIPGGRIEEGETSVDTVNREVDEEFGIKPIHMIRLGSFLDTTISGDFQHVDAYLVSVFSGNVENKEPEKCELVWIERDKALEALELASSKLVITWANGMFDGGK
jgi:8-oxo-dGTP pyrophosphatase MutT (NUDIX family)